MMIKDVPIDSRPRERLIKYGVDSLSNVELLSIIIKSGMKNKSSFELASEILNRLESLDKIKEFQAATLLDVKGVGIAKACEIIASIELGRRIYLTDEKREKIKLVSSKEVYKSMKYYLNNKKQECFYCIYVNNKNQILERKMLFMGTVNKSIVHPREVFKYAHLSSASGIICVHNHPSGDVNPSIEDIELTKALIDIGKIQAIPILDHVIIGNDCYYSMADNLELFL